MQARIDPRTGATYYTHAPESDRRTPVARGYVDPTEEFGARAFEYQQGEIDDFERTTREFASRRVAPIPEPAAKNTLSGHVLSNGPFARFTEKLKDLVRRRNTIRELIGILGPMGGGVNVPSPRTQVDYHGAFFLKTIPNGGEIYTLMADPPAPTRTLADETFELDDSSLEALIQERMRIELKFTPTFSYRFYFE